ncbi:MAG: hypothetical protein HC902_07210 [Calothrix sp. SM1_5_4]|nr:hypothetical protein [Calothrix sp. SM1_5_4]
MKSNGKRPKISILHDEIPEHVQEFMQLTRLAEMGRLSASVAHEINNPLMVVQGFAENIELLLDQKNVPKDEIRLQILQIIKACHRMSRIVNKMNRMSRQQKLRLHVVDLAEVALNAVDFMKVQFTDMDVRLEFDFTRPLPIKCDALQVEQMLLNILSNALSALEEREQDRRLRISFEQVGKWHQVKVWNNGPAIPPHVQANLMSPFVTTKTSGDGDGAGLGLAISKAIMTVHGGDLSFASSHEKGTEFTLSFPIPKQNPWVQGKRQNGGKAFIIDPQPNYRHTLREKFRLLGFDVADFADFETGFKALVNEPNVAGLFIDVVPGLPESLNFLRRLRQQMGPSALIFTMSNYPSAREFKGELKAAGASECFENPFMPITSPLSSSNLIKPTSLPRRTNSPPELPDLRHSRYNVRS